MKHSQMIETPESQNPNSEISSSHIGSNIISATHAFIRLIALVSIVAMALWAVSEIAERQQYSALLDAEIQSAKAAISEEKARDYDNGSNAKVEFGAIQKLLLLERSKADLNSLVATGTNSYSQTLPGIRARLRSQITGEEPENVDFLRLPPINYLEFIGLNPYTMGADHLLALAVIMCGSTGALLSSIRKRKFQILTDLTQGCLSGFVTFLALKGGKHLFLISTVVDTAAFNPYSCAFAGILAGLFSERAYLLLGSVVEQVAGRIEQTLK